MVAGRPAEPSARLDLVRVLIVGGSPAAASPATVREAARGCDVVVAVDRGLDRVRAAGLMPDLFCGDADSVSKEGARQVAEAEAAQAAGERAAFDVVRYNPHKDDTDLGLALGECARRWPGARLRATCLTGGNPDHALAVLGRLAAYAASFAADGAAGRTVESAPKAEVPPAVELVEDGFSARIVQTGATWCIDGARGARFSFVPLSAAGAVVSERGMCWELDRAPVALLDDLGISNVIERDRATIACHAGIIACWLFPRC